MATSSPVPNNNKVGDSLTAIAAINGNGTPQQSTTFEMPKQNLRGLNKPKCIKCGNVARSRCPFQSCKSCCSKAQNPCHIHVLKQNSTLPDKPPPSTAPLVEQPSMDVPSTGASWRLNSLRQLSTTFANSLRAKKPLTRKDALNINKWRFMKLREHIEGNIEAEKQAFERYMQNVSLLEETFSVLVGPKPDEQPALDSSTSEDKIQMLVSEMKLKIKADPDRANRFRETLRNLLDQKLTKLQERELVSDDVLPYDNEPDEQRGLKRPKKAFKWRSERSAAVDELIDKLNRARNEDDLKACLELKHQLFNQSDCNAGNTLKNLNTNDHLEPKKESDSTTALSSYSLPKACVTIQIDQDMLSNINTEFSSLSKIAEL